jgi:alcohol dehydrogenase class IV
MRFYVPTDLRVGAGIVAESGDAMAAFGKRCLLVTGKRSAVLCGALANVTDALDRAGVAWTVFDGIEQNPSVESCRAAGKAAASVGADFLVGIGGGSPLDAAKAAAIFAADPELTEEDLYAYAWPEKISPVVCVGTTAGTGSEVTPVSVLTNGAGRKQSIRDDRIYPALSLGDGRYLRALPDAFLRSCGVDAAAHCIESFFSRKQTDISRTFALRGLVLLRPIFEKLRGGDGLDDDERQTLYLGSIYGGYAISVTGTAFPHALGYYLTESHSVAHGTACGVFLPAFLRHAKQCDALAAARFETVTGLGADAWADLLTALLPPFGVRLDIAQIALLADRYDGNSGIARSPGEITRETLTAILTEVYTK